MLHQFHMFYIFALFSVFIDNKSLYESFGFYKEHPIIIGFVLFSDALAPMDTVVKLLMNILSRKFEFEAGSFTLLCSCAPTLANVVNQMNLP
jgi:STE24 endopeptidase